MENLFEPVYRHYTAREIKSAGWMKKQLRIQAEGLSGHLDLKSLCKEFVSWTFW